MPAPSTAELIGFLRTCSAMRLRADQWRWFWTFWGGGGKDDPESFDADGGATGDLGYYPVIFADETVRYLPCLERFTALMIAAISASPNLVARMVGKSIQDILEENVPVPGAMLVLPLIDRAPNVALAATIVKLIPWGETDRFRLEAIRHPNALEILLTYD